jgi:hypothetical protein
MVNLSREQSIKIIDFIKKNGLTQSIVKNYFDCKWKFYLKLSGLIFKRNSTEKTDFGTIVHSILEKWYLTKGKIFEDKTALKQFITDEAKNNNMFFKNDIIVQLKVYYTMLAYFEIYKNDLKYLILNVEQKFINNIHNQSGKRDLEVKKKNSIIIVDHKTKSRIDENNLLAGLNLDFQSLFYLLSVDSANEVMINIIRNSQKKNFDENFYYEILKNADHYFKRYNIMYTKKDKNDFLILWNTIKNNIEDDIETLNIFPNYFHCIGNYECEYLDYCNKKCKNNNNYEIKQFNYKELE